MLNKKTQEIKHVEIKRILDAPKKYKILIPAAKWNTFYTWPSYRKINKFIEHCGWNKFDMAIRYLNGRILIIEKEFFKWVDKYLNTFYEIEAAHDFKQHNITSKLISLSDWKTDYCWPKSKKSFQNIMARYPGMIKEDVFVNINDMSHVIYYINPKKFFKWIENKECLKTNLRATKSVLKNKGFSCLNEALSDLLFLAKKHIDSKPINYYTAKSLSVMISNIYYEEKKLIVSYNSILKRLKKDKHISSKLGIKGIIVNRNSPITYFNRNKKLWCAVFKLAKKEIQSHPPRTFYVSTLAKHLMCKYTTELPLSLKVTTLTYKLRNNNEIRVLLDLKEITTNVKY